MKLTGQIGEHLVVAELGRRMIIATPFSGNVPDIDVIAYANKKSTHIQVKAINGPLGNSILGSSLTLN